MQKKTEKKKKRKQKKRKNKRKKRQKKKEKKRKRKKEKEKEGEKRRVVEARASLILVTRGPVQSSFIEFHETNHGFKFYRQK